MTQDQKRKPTGSCHVVATRARGRVLYMSQSKPRPCYRKELFCIWHTLPRYKSGLPLRLICAQIRDLRVPCRPITGVYQEHTTAPHSDHIKTKGRADTSHSSERLSNREAAPQQEKQSNRTVVLLPGVSHNQGRGKPCHLLRVIKREKACAQPESKKLQRHEVSLGRHTKR